MATYGLEKKNASELKKITDEVVREVLGTESLNIDKILLYGSYARGDANDESDIDIMILCDNPKEYVQEIEKKIWRAVDKIGFDNDIMIQAVVQSKDFFQYWVDVLPFYRNVRDEGVLLYG